MRIRNQVDSWQNPAVAYLRGCTMQYWELSGAEATCTCIILLARN